ncbi:MAG: helix-turn-helix transcriptional regulator [Sulfuricella sp.]|jgi:transcriptional regulator with XRE-family HTH domain
MGTENQTSKDARRRIAENIRRLRMERGLSQEGMAELADFHRTYVSQLERCVTNISIDGLERLAMALGVDISILLEDSSTPSRAGQPKEASERKQS